MLTKQTTIQFCGFGGQGIVLSSVVFGTTAVTRAGLQAVQTQSYGSEARGGECQAELILSPERIKSPISNEVEVLVALSRPALTQYLPRLKPGGTLIIDPDLIKNVPETEAKVIAIPATQTANSLGVKMVMNMYVLGFLQQATGLFSADDLFAVISENTPARFEEVNLKAAHAGMDYAKTQSITLEL